MFESPFNKEKVVFHREPTFSEKWSRFFFSKIDEWFVQAIPSEDVKQMPPEYLYPVGFVLLVLLAAIFIAIFVPNYTAQLNTQYLSPAEYSNTAFCDSVPISNTGIFLASQSGRWEATIGFQYSDAAYVLDISAFSLTSEDFASSMNQIYEELLIIGKRAVNQDLAQNLMSWMTFVYLNPEYPSQRFYLVGDPVNVFNRQVTAGAISGITADCTNISTAKFDPANGQLTLNYNYNEFINDPTCKNIVDPNFIGYTYYANPSSFAMPVDIRSLITALAVNIGILSLSSLQEISSSKPYYFEYNGTIYNATLYANAQFPNMVPISCVRAPTPVRCVITLGEVVTFPIFNHLGQSTEYPKPCNCSYFQANNITENSNNSAYSFCNNFFFLTGLIFYNSSNPLPLFELSLKYSLKEISDYSYYPMFLASAWGQYSPYRDELNQNRSQAYEFCRLPNGMHCNFLTFSSFDNAFLSWDISSYYYQLTNGACTDSFSSTEENWNLLIEYPFAPLTEGYTKCHYSTSAILTNQAGIAVGNVSILMPFGVIFVLIILYYYQICTGRFIPRGYTKAEKDKALELLAISLLLAKDNKLEVMKKRYLQRQKEKRKNEQRKVGISAEDSNQIKAIEEENEAIDLELIQSLVQELKQIGEIGQEEYFRIKEEELKYENTAINWEGLYMSLSGRKKKTSKMRIWSDAMKSEDLARKEYTTPIDSNIVTVTEDALKTPASPVQIELSTMSALHHTLSTDSNSSSSKKIMTVLNSSPVNQKIANRYRQMIGKFASSSLFLPEVENTLQDAISERLRSIAASSDGKPSFFTIDLENSSQGSHQLAEVLKSTEPANRSSNRESGLKSLFSASAPSASGPSRYNPEIIQLLLNYWIPKFDHWLKEFQSIQNQDVSASQGSTSYWLLASNLSELQLFTIMNKAKFHSFILFLEELCDDPGRISIEDISVILVFGTIFEKIKQLMIYHAGLSLECPFDQIEKKYDQKIGYLIGEELWTLLEVVVFVGNMRKIRDLLESAIPQNSSEKSQLDLKSEENN